MDGLPPGVSAASLSGRCQHAGHSPRSTRLQPLSYRPQSDAESLKVQNARGDILSPHGRFCVHSSTSMCRSGGEEWDAGCQYVSKCQFVDSRRPEPAVTSRYRHSDVLTGLKVTCPSV